MFTAKFHFAPIEVTLPLWLPLFRPLCETSAAFSPSAIQRRDPPQLPLVPASVPSPRDKNDSSSREKGHAGSRYAEKE